MTIKEFFEQNSKVAIAFSGGVDSAYLLCAAKEAGADVTAYYVKSQFQPEFELKDAVRTAEMLGAKMRILSVDALKDAKVRSNPEDRCYYCKQNIMNMIIKSAAADGFAVICDGTNASDDADDRPGFKALGELGIRSPLRECGITKEEIRAKAREAGLHVWDKPAYACLATRIPVGEEITEEKLKKTEAAETKLFDMGYEDFRVRMRGDSALIQVRADQYLKAVNELKTIKTMLGNLYTEIVLDEKTR